MRFAFYGRVSTEDQQDPTSSRNWQLARGRQLIEPVDGEIVGEFFDLGQSRSLPWPRRPEAARLLKTLADPDRGFDAVVIGEPQRAFYGNQFGLTFPVFVHYGVQLWVPEVGGAVDPGSDAHEIVMSLYGGMSKGERNRIKTRVRSAMQAQVAIEGRFQGGRPPFGYRLADAGAHPNPSKAGDGRRLHRLEPDPMTAPVVRRIFSEFVHDKGLHAIASMLTVEGILSPSASDPGRNPHRQQNGPEWRHTAVRAILKNPRYLGYEVWNRQKRHEILLDVHDVALGHHTRMRWNDEHDWVRSKEQTHEPLVSDELWDAAQAAFTQKRRAAHRTPIAGRHYVLAGLVRCGACGRRMEGSWNNAKPYYRCQIHRDDPVDRAGHPPTIYMKEEAILPQVDEWLAELFDDDHLDDTCRALADATEVDPDEAVRRKEMRDRIAKMDEEIEAYRTILREQPVTAPEVGKWMAETVQDKRRLENLLGLEPTTKLTVDDVEAMIAGLRDITRSLALADPAIKAAAYAELGITVTYHREGRALLESRPQPSDVADVRVGGGT
jgi:DNA invertase Pin-like site-specific DNA recombinase